MFKNEADFEKLVSRLNIDNKPNPAHRENLRRQMLSAFNEAGEQCSSQATVFQTFRRTIMKSPISKLAAAAVIIIAVFIGIRQFGGSIESLALADVVENMKKMPWIELVETQCCEGQERAIHRWYDFGSDRAFEKAENAVWCWDHAEEKQYFYSFADDRLEITKLPETIYGGTNSTSTFVDDLVQYAESEEFRVTQRKDRLGGDDVVIFELSKSYPDKNNSYIEIGGTTVATLKIKLIVNQENKLLVAGGMKWLDGKGKTLTYSNWQVTYPESGPKDIYALGVPQTAKIRDLTDTSTAKTIDKSNQYAKDTAAPKLEPIDIKLPRAMFEGTPQPVQVSHWKKPLGKPRPPFLAPVGTKNVAFEKPVTSTDELPIIGELEMITDGDKEGADGSFVELGLFKQSVTIDLEAEYDIYAILFWHYHMQSCVFFDVVVQVADDPDFITGVTTLFNNDIDNSAGLGIGKDMHYTETNEGKLIDARGVRARYVRLYSNGSTANDLNRYIEVEVFAKPAK